MTAAALDSGSVYTLRVGSSSFLLFLSIYAAAMWIEVRARTALALGLEPG